MSKKTKKKKQRRSRDDDLSIITDVKEPFSWANFWDEQIVGRYKAIKQFLEEKGILFFLTSPFQYRNRLILKLWVIVLGVLIGVVPRSMLLINQTKSRNAASEFSTIKDSRFTLDTAVITPLTSGHYERTHVLTFIIDGETTDGVPSTTDKYKVTLEPSRGVSYFEDVSYKYIIVPLTSNRRVLVVYVDNSEQNDTTGVYNLTIAMGDSKMKTPMEISLSDTQDNTSIYEDGVINLSALSSQLSASTTNDKSTPIKDAEDQLKEALEVYQLQYDRITGAGYQVKPEPKDLEAYIKDQYLILSKVTDKSTTKDVTDLDTIVPELPVIISSITVDGVEYTDENKTQDLGTRTVQATELPNITTAVTNILSAATTLNSARVTKTETLQNLSRVLNADIELDDMADGVNKMTKDK